MFDLLGRVGYWFFLLRVTPREIVCLITTCAVMLGCWILLDRQVAPYNETHVNDFNAIFFASAIHGAASTEPMTMTQYSGAPNRLNSFTVATSGKVTRRELLQLLDKAIGFRLTQIDPRFTTPIQGFTGENTDLLYYEWKSAHRKGSLFLKWESEKQSSVSGYDVEQRFVFRGFEE